jgi:dienelactone hydrolase
LGNSNRGRRLLGLIALLVAVGAGPATAQTVEDVVFAGNVIPGSDAIRPVQLQARLYLPPGRAAPWSVVVISPSSGGVNSAIDGFYAERLTQAGIAALLDGGRRNEDSGPPGIRTGQEHVHDFGNPLLGGAEEQRTQGARDMVAFLKKHGF